LQQGTYIRSLAFDFGMNSGSHLTALRRTKLETMIKEAVDVVVFEDNLESK
jgi:tRNA U55 pseudouridine synthase TruB